jgi:hypothetical protein
MRPVGTAMAMLEAAKDESAAWSPTINMWCAQISKLSSAMATVEAATNG